MTTSHLLLLSLATHVEFMGQQIEVSWASPLSTFMFRGLAHENYFRGLAHEKKFRGLAHEKNFVG